MDPLVWATILLVAGILLVGIEFFVPSGGILAVTATISILSAIAIAYYNGGFAIGTLFLIIAVVTVPLMLSFGFKILPHTPIGKQLMGRAPTSDEVLSDIATRRNQRALIGSIGLATTSILPSGSVEIEGRTIDAVSQGIAIEKGTPVKIIDVQGTRIVVRPCYPHEIEQAKKQHSKTLDEKEMLSQPLESFGLEGLDEPLK